MNDSDLKQRNTKLALTAFAVVAGMIGLSFAFVPFYDAFCRALGINGATQIADAPSDSVIDVPVTVRLDSNVDKALPWEFYPVEKSVTLKIGETYTVHYVAKNISDKPTTGTATFNVTPEKAGLYFSKIDCFCFQEQLLQPGESVDMAVSFFVDPDMIDNETTEEIRTITLSYTFFRSLEDMTLEESAELRDESVAPTKLAAVAN